ncbi:siphovirus ReqiPepy6 Gp37-like family protein [Tissierella carlieri]|uniref:Siphovirus ReqiPepy6 Gp37-like family protein n=1 Tax=Tissierella carlieri TaxID=689904 RepID=A0ABT1S526_9FIRM|nr:siphovirus ReqiPepy6 Gp37-like family protein [Tissierella carlieri]MCQ4921566.1 siphovirus ReqiPepy6 Gp37-like family protein [Tissierella carlieri]
MELYIFDRDLNFKGLLDNYFSFRWVRRYYRCGEFELHCGLTPDLLVLLQRGSIVWKKDDLEAGYIEYRNISQDIEGKEVLIAKGKFLTGYLNRRIIWGTKKLNTTSELAIRELINKNCINPTNLDRKVNRFTLGEIKNYTQNINYQVSYKNLLEEIESIAATSGLGFRILIDVANKLIVFDIYEGLNRTADQTVNSPAIFSKEFENVLEQEYTDNISNYRNVALIAGEGEGAARQLATIGQGSGLDRFELFVDARDLQKDNRTTQQYTELLENRGNTKLTEHKEIRAFDSKINQKSNLIYKEDFDLGDIVTCTSKKWGLTIDTRITEIEEIYESNGFNINMVFGNNMPTLIDKIKQVVR